MKSTAPSAERAPGASPRTTGEALAHLVAALCRLARQGLARKERLHDGVHRVRKAIRSLRAVLALAHEALGEPAAPIDRALQQLARSLSRLRDAHVAVATARSLATGAEKQAWLDVAARLDTRCERRLARTLAQDPGFAKRRARLARISKALAALPWYRVGRRSLEHALVEGELRVAKAERKAKKEMTAQRLHRWRRRARRLRMQVDAMRRIEVCPKTLRKMQHERVEHLKKRTDLLGRRQDLEVLAQLLPQVSDMSNRDALRCRLHQEIAELDASA
ncbi:CHAD domain-containing protein [Dyella sp.]|uniref:CHAD domain-containing protein n=1 Tax=Dyella sp. TaxID=1869338 RepID=UPI003F8191AC